MTQRADWPSPSVFSFAQTSRFIQAEKEPASHTLLRMNNVSGEPLHEEPLRSGSGERCANITCSQARMHSISIQSRETEQIDVHSLSYFGKKYIILIILSVAVQSC